MRRWGVFAVVGLLLLALAFWAQTRKAQQVKTSRNFIAAAKAGKDPEAVVRAFLWALKVGDFRLAHELMDRASRKKVTPSQFEGLLVTAKGKPIRVAQIRSIKITRQSANKAFADFVVTLDGFPTDAVVLNQHTIPPLSPLQRFSFGRKLWEKLTSKLPPTFNSAPSGGFLEVGLGRDGVIIRRYDPFLPTPLFAFLRTPTLSASAPLHFFFRRYELVREGGKWRIANAISP